MHRQLLHEAQLRFDAETYGLNREQLADRYGWIDMEVEGILSDFFFSDYMEAARNVEDELKDLTESDFFMVNLGGGDFLDDVLEPVTRTLIAAACALKNPAVTRELLVVINQPDYEATLSLPATEWAALLHARLEHSNSAEHTIINQARGGE